jgi:hypothetical protein
VKTDEFLKSGGSIYCMRQDLYASPPRTLG